MEVPGCFDVEEERGTDVEEQGTGVEAHAEDVMEGAWRTRRRSGRRRVCGGEITGLLFRGLGTLKKNNNNDGHDDVIDARRYI
jgi:hypothetical protein